MGQRIIIIAATFAFAALCLLPAAFGPSSDGFAVKTPQYTPRPEIDG